MEHFDLCDSYTFSRQDREVFIHLQLLSESVQLSVKNFRFYLEVELFFFLTWHATKFAVQKTTFFFTGTGTGKK